ncbi:MAG: adenylate kinase [Bacilli bacterium]
MKNIIFIAPPAAGKGTVSARVCDKYNIPHISTGDLLRDEIKNSTKLGIEIKDAMARGEFVSDEVITKLLRKRLLNKDCKKGYILDGYPRNVNQAITYDKLLLELGFDLGKVILLDIDMDTAMKRALSRVVCSKCGLSYNLSNKDLSPIKEGICDSCGGSLKSRSDDTEETFINRFDTYMKETFPLIEYYDNKNNLVKIDVTNKNSDEVFEEVEKVIK